MECSEYAHSERPHWPVLRLPVLQQNTNEYGWPASPCKEPTPAIVYIENKKVRTLHSLYVSCKSRVIIEYLSSTKMKIYYYHLGILFTNCQTSINPVTITKFS